MKKVKSFYLLLLIFLAASCAKDQLLNPPDHMPNSVNSLNAISSKIKIAVVSDIHYLDPSLMPESVSDPYFQFVMSYDRKLIELSDPILRQTISELKAERPDILLITGDLSCNGELVSHEAVKSFLQQLGNEGIKVFVIPGNNDINNSDAWDFNKSESAENITPEQFGTLYENFGYNEAISRDVNSLSYVCQPVSGLWILGIDANETVSSGAHAIGSSTMDWILSNMEEARDNNITVLAMMHYGIIEHYSNQNILEKLIDNFEVNANTLMDAGLRFIFTGHYHANDIVEYTNAGKTLTDIETGSLVTPLSPYRIMTLDNNLLKIETRRITSVDATMPDGTDFLTYSDINITSRLNNFFTFVLENAPFSFPQADASVLAPSVTNAFKAYFEGDEKISPAESNEIEALPYPLVVNILNSIWTDLPPKDNKVYIKLK